MELTFWLDRPRKQAFKTGPSVCGAISYQAGAIWPYRFVTTVWHQLLAEFPATLALETHTPVTDILATSPSSGAEESHPYTLQTPRGPIQARHVIHATNAHASHLVPGLRRKIIPAKAHMSAQRPGDQFPADHGAHRSWSVIYGGGFDYVTQLRPDGDAGQPQSSQGGDLMVGGGFFRTLKRGIDMLAVSDDGGGSLDGLTLAHVAGILPAVFSPEYWGTGGGVKKAWSGILGFTGDLLPLVGRLDDAVTGRKVSSSSSSSGEWVVAGFSGEGMAWSWMSGTALGIIVSGREDEELPAVPGQPAGKLEEWFPWELYVSKERLKRADLRNLTGHL